MPDEEYTSENLGTIVIEEERLKESFTQIPNAILKRSDISPGAKLTYVMLLTYAHQKDSCFPGQASLARDMGAGERSVIRYLKELQEAQLLLVKRRGLGKTNVYTLTRWATPRSAKLADQEVPARSAKLAPQELPNRQTEEQEDKEQEEQQHVVVGELTERGLTRMVAERLAKQYEEKRIREKLDLVAWLVETKSKLVGKNPAGYLRRAIEEDYAPPPNYQTPAELQAEEDRKARLHAQAEASIAADRKRRATELEEERRKKDQALRAFRKEHPAAPIAGTNHTTETAWQNALSDLQKSMSGPNYTTWLAETILASVDASTAVLVAPNGFVAEWLRKRFSSLIRKSLQGVLGYPVELEVLALTELEASGNLPLMGRTDLKSRPSTSVQTH